MKALAPLFLIVLWLAPPAIAQPAPPAQGAAPVARPTTAIDPAGCVTEQCHVGVKQHKVVHGPVNVNACDACHTLTNPAEHKYEMARGKTEMCTFCHQVDTGGMPVVHKPVADGDCLGCHDPHGGATIKFVRGGDNMAAMCATCHKDVIANKKNVHGPAAAGACVSCHPAHASQYPKLLAAEGRDLCFSCHNEMKQQMATVAFQHKAVEADCSSCHDPHASDYPMQTRLPPVELCTSCHEHEPIKTAALSSKNKHSIVIEGDGCLNCHTAHGGDLSKLMKNDQLKVCMKCHEQPITSSTGKVVAGVPEVLDQSMTRHGPAQQGECGGCHNVHGSDVSRLLAKAYPEPFYQSFALDKYDLCFGCHDAQLVTTKKTTGLTRFRNGDENLHFLHVNKSDRGRNCRACHATHAAADPLLVRDTVPYGKWDMPLNFKTTETGGSCSPGCHKPYDYDRETPVNYTAPAATPTTSPAAQEDKP